MNNFQNANTLAHAVNETASSQYTPRPYNRLKPGDTTWWLVPGTDWPAFRHAKLFFHSKREDVPDGIDGIFCGLNAEKGLSVKVRDFYPKELIKSANWDWDDAVVNLVKNWPTFSTRQYVSLSLSYIPPDGSVNSVESFLDLKREFRASHSFFTVETGGELKPYGERYLNDKCFEIAEHFRTHILASDDVRTLLQRVEAFPQSDWCWIDLYIGAVVNGGNVGSLWQESLKPWCGVFPGQRCRVGA